MATESNFIPFDWPGEALRVAAKIRHGHAPAPAEVRPLGERRVEVRFDEPQRAVTPGQSVVFYDGEQVIGGGIITRS